MAYTKTNWTNGTTPINETNLNKIETELKNLDDNSLMYLGLVPVDDLNDLKTNGYYQTSNKTLANAGDDYNWCVLFCVKNGTATRQILIKNTFIKTRTFSGNPATWSSWATFEPGENAETVLARKTSSLTSSVGTLDESYKWCRRSGNTISFFISITITTAITNGWSQPLAVFPSGYRPNNYTLMTLAVGSQSSTSNQYKSVTAAVNPNGNLEGDWKLSVRR